MSEGIYRGVEAATELLAEKKYNEAIEKLTKIADKGSDYEKAVVNYNLGFAYSSKNDHANATKAFAKALSFNALPQRSSEQLQYNLGQLYIVAGQFDEGIRTLQDYIAECVQARAGRSAHLPRERADGAQALSTRRCRRSIWRLSRPRSRRRCWLQMKLAISYELKDFKGCAQALVQLIGIVPAKPEYWKQLSSMFYEMKQDAEAVAVLALAERQGFVEKPNEIKNLYSVYMMLELPFKAGTAAAGRDGEGPACPRTRSQSRIGGGRVDQRARDRARGNGAEEARGHVGEGRVLLQARRHVRRRRALEGIEGDAEKALDEGRAQAYRRSVDASRRRGVQARRTPSAVAALQKAVGFDETRKQAGEWLRHLSGQSRRIRVAFLSAAEVGGGSRRRARASRSRYSICPLTLRSSEAARRSNCAHTSGGRRSRNAFLPGLANVCRQG